MKHLKLFENYNENNHDYLYNLALDFVDELKKNKDNSNINKIDYLIKSREIKNEIRNTYNVRNPHDLPKDLEEIYFLIVDTTHKFMMGIL